MGCSETNRVSGMTGEFWKTWGTRKCFSKNLHKIPGRDSPPFFKMSKSRSTLGFAGKHFQE